MLIPSCLSVHLNVLLVLQIGDETGQMTAQMNLADLKSVLGIRSAPGEHIRYGTVSNGMIASVSQ